MHHRETANGYLERIARAAIVRNKTKRDIQRSIVILSDKINHYFNDQVEKQVTFGSYQRKTMLPRRMDAQSDVDLMILFKGLDAKPRAYLNRLRRFAEVCYARHEILPSHPTIMLELNHIRFELIPSVIGSCGDLLIPAKTTDMEDWQTTVPSDFEERLAKKNQTHSQQILLFIRVMKYWNVIKGRPFGSYELEQAIVKTGYRSRMSLWFGGKWSILDYVSQFSTTYKPSGYSRSYAVQDLQITIKEVLLYVKDGDQAQAVQLLRQFLPLPM